MVALKFRPDERICRVLDSSCTKKNIQDGDNIILLGQPLGFKLAIAFKIQTHINRLTF